MSLKGSQTLVNQLSTYVMGAGVVLCIGGRIVRLARVPGGEYLSFASIGLISAALVAHLILYFLIRMKWIDKSLVEMAPAPLFQLPPPPQQAPIEIVAPASCLGDFMVDRNTDRVVTDLSEHIDAAIQGSAIRAAARDKVARIVFERPHASVVH